MGTEESDVRMAEATPRQSKGKGKGTKKSGKARVPAPFPLALHSEDFMGGPSQSDEADGMEDERTPRASKTKVATAAAATVRAVSTASSNPRRHIARYSPA